MNSIYLDHAAATPIDPTVLAAMQPYFAGQFYNPSATYLAAQKVRQDLDKARANVAHWLGAKPAEVVFTAGGTEANNLAIHGVMGQFKDGEVITSAVEHESVLAAASLYPNSQAPVGADGVVLVDNLIKLITDKTVLISVMYANNEVGTIQPIRKIALAIEAIRNQRQAAGNTRPLYLHTDAAQAAGYLDIHASRLGVDLLTLNSGKIYGPKQVGALYVSSRVKLRPQMLGGGQERGLRSGTENVAGVIGLSAALTLAQSQKHQESQRLKILQNLFFELAEQKLGAVSNGSRKVRLPNNVHLTLPGSDNERLIFQLDEHGIMCAAGSACSADSGQPSHVLSAMGISDQAARSSLRFTLGRSTTADHIHSTIDQLAKLLP